jgi:hypothetical protein
MKIKGKTFIFWRYTVWLTLENFRKTTFSDNFNELEVLKGKRLLQMLVTLGLVTIVMMTSSALVVKRMASGKCIRVAE